MAKGLKPDMSHPPPEVKCARVRCKGANHHHSCPVYVWAVENWNVTMPQPPPKPKRIDKRVGKHIKKDPKDLMPKELRDNMAREYGKLGGGVRCEVPKHLIDILRKGKFRVREEYQKPGDPVSEAAAELAGWAMERLATVAAGRVHTRKAPSVCKSAGQIREEICEPIEKAVVHRGGIDLGKALDSIPVPTTRPSDEEPAPVEPPKALQ